MTAGERVGSVTSAWSTDTASLSLILHSNVGGTGSTSVTVHGANMGLTTYTGSTRVGLTGCEST
eukprot:3635732-Rhodomonas_salina.1